MKKKSTREERVAEYKKAISGKQMAMQGYATKWDDCKDIPLLIEEKLKQVLRDGLAYSHDHSAGTHQLVKIKLKNGVEEKSLLQFINSCAVARTGDHGDLHAAFRMAEQKGLVELEHKGYQQTVPEETWAKCCGRNNIETVNQFGMCITITVNQLNKQKQLFSAMVY